MTPGREEQPRILEIGLHMAAVPCHQVLLSFWKVRDMGLMEKLRSDLNDARRSRTDPARVALLSTLVGEAARVGKDQGNRETTDAEALAVVRKFVKNAEQTLADATRAGRATGPILAEVAILSAYLPAGVPGEEVERSVREILEAKGASGKAAMGVVVKGLKDRYGAAFDGAAMTPIAKRLLEGQ